VLIRELWEGLGDLAGVTLFGPPPEARRTPTLSFTVKDLASAEVCRRLADRGVFASHGDFYATTVARRLGAGTSGFVRVGCACYTTSEEVTRVIEAVSAILAGEE
jgi:selenocysteine lyase/cysteine desulfurase